jgi:tetratricopeptide (TPR) repeat protein
MAARQVLTLKIEVRVLAGEPLLWTRFLWPHWWSLSSARHGCVVKVPVFLKRQRFGSGFMHRLGLCLAVPLVFSSLSGCTRVGPLLPGAEYGNQYGNTVQNDVANASRSVVTPDLRKQSDSLHNYLAGNLSLNNENYRDALEYFTKSEESLEEPAPALHSKMADLYLRFGELDKALYAADKALSEDSTDPYVRMLYAGVLEALGRSAEAEPMYRGLIEEFPSKFDPYILLANLYAKQKRFDEGVKTLQALVQLHPREAIGHYYLGRMYEQLENLPEAEREYVAVLELEPASQSGFAELVRVLLKQKKTARARAECERMLEREPSNALARKVVSHIMLGESKLDGALEHLQVLEGLESDATDTRFKIALIQIEKQNFKEALRELSLVLATNPKHAEARYYYASILASSGRTEEAVDELLEIEKGSAMFVRSRTFAAFILRQDRERKRALKAVREGLSVEPDNLNLGMYEVLILRDLGKLAEAEEQLRGRLQKAPREERLLFNLGLILGDRGKVDESITVMESLLAINPKHSDALNFVAYALAETGQDLERAQHYARRALEGRPRDGFYLDTLGWIQFKQGQLSEAENTMEQAVSASGEDIVIVEHYIEVLVAAKKLPRAVAIMKGVADRLLSEEESRDEEKTAAYNRIRQRLDLLLRSNPELRHIEKSSVRNAAQQAEV